MPKGNHQKAKLLYLARILMEQTDEDHTLSVAQLIAKLREQGVDVRDRKSIYDDFETLRLFGLDLESRREGRTWGYYLASRLFELPELKLLVDAVQSSRFVTQNKTEKLIAKLEALTSRHQARQLQRQVFVSGRVKAVNESIYYSVDALHSAIDSGRQIRFHYFEWVLSGGKPEKKLRREGGWYQVSPWALIWQDENYYLAAYSGETQEIRHYRVDKMQDITLLPSAREGGAILAQQDPGAYAETMFGMYHGEAQSIRLRLENHLLGVAVDRFGSSLFPAREDDAHFSVTVHATVSPQFFGWIFSLGGGAKILSPQTVRDAYVSFLRHALQKEEVL